MTFLAAYSKCGNVTEASRVANVSRSRHYEWLKTQPNYAQAFSHAHEEAIDSLESTARDRAVAGSDTLLIFLLKGARPEKYRDRFEHHHSGEIREVSFVINGNADELAQESSTSEDALVWDEVGKIN